MATRKIDKEVIQSQPDIPLPDPIEVAADKIIDLYLKDMLEPTDEECDAINNAVDELIVAVRENTPHAIYEEISVYYPEQLFSPVPYNSFRCGNLWYKTVVKPEETVEEAYARAWEYLSKLVKEQYQQAKKDFWERHNSMSI